MSKSKLEALQRSRNQEGASSRRPMPAWLIPAGILAAFVVLFAALFRDRLMPAKSVQAASVVAIEANESIIPISNGSSEAISERFDGPAVFQASGWIEPDPYAVKATALVDGVVEEVNVLEGELVEEGQLLATLIDEDFELRLASARSELERRVAAREAYCAGIARLEADLKAKESERDAATAVREAASDRLERLKQSIGRSVSERDLVEARHELTRTSALLASAEARVSESANRLEEFELEATTMLRMIEAAEVKVAEAKLALKRTRILSPITGRVLRLLAAPGKKRMLGMDDHDSGTIAILYDPKRLQVRVDVPLADAAGLSVGQLVRIRSNLLPDKIQQGRVTRIVGEADIQRNTLQAKVEIIDPDPALRPEMLSRVEFLAVGQAPADAERPAAGNLAMWVPENAIDGEGQVWAIAADSSKVDAREVDVTSERKDEFRRVLAGVKPGEQVVLNPNGLREGQRVRISMEGQP